MSEMPISLRDYCAAQFFAAMLSNPFTAQELVDKPQEMIERRLAVLAFGMADAFMIERQKTIQRQANSPAPP